LALSLTELLLLEYCFTGCWICSCFVHGTFAGELRLLSRSGFYPENIADAGSGFGQYVYHLSKRFPDSHITGLDIKQEQVDDCNAFFSSIELQEKVSFEYADLTTLNAIEAYDLILSVDVIGAYRRGSPRTRAGFIKG